MRITFVNSRNSKTSDSHILIFTFSKKINLNSSAVIKTLLYQILAFLHEEYQKNPYNNSKFEVLGPTHKKMNDLMDYIIY